MIRVTDDYVIDVDYMSYAVERDEHRTFIQKSGSRERELPLFKNLAYYSKFSMALAYIAERISKDRLITTGEIPLQDAIRIIQESYREVAEAVKDIAPQEINGMWDEWDKNRNRRNLSSDGEEE